MSTCGICTDFSCVKCLVQCEVSANGTGTEIVCDKVIASIEAALSPFPWAASRSSDSLQMFYILIVKAQAKIF